MPAYNTTNNQHKVHYLQLVQHLYANNLFIIV
jgi:hypothetical protein